MSTHTITIQIDTNADESLILELAIAAAERLAQDLEDHGHDASFDDDEVTVSSD